MTPFHRQMEGITSWCIERAHNEGVPFIWVPHPGDALIGRARSIMATQFLTRFPCEYMIFLDSDIEFEPKDLMRLYFDMVDKGHELIGGVYTVRSADQLAHFGIGGRTILDNQIHEVAYLSTGFMGIAKSLLKRMVEELKLPLCHPKEEHINFQCYPFFESGASFFEGANEWIYRSEDWDFCDKARKVGVKPYLDTSILLGHRGEKMWYVKDLRKDMVEELPNHHNGIELRDTNPSARNSKKRRKN